MTAHPRTVAALLGLLAAGNVQSQVIVSSYSAYSGYPTSPWMGPAKLTNFSYMTANPYTWVGANWTDAYPTRKFVFRDFDMVSKFNQTDAMIDGWRFSAILNVSNAGIKVGHASPYGNLGAVVLAIRLPGCLFDLWFSNNAAGDLFIQPADALLPDYHVGPAVIVPGIGTSSFWLVEIYNPQSKTVTVFVNDKAVPGLTNIPALDLQPNQLTETRGVNFGLSSTYGTGKIALTECSLQARGKTKVVPTVTQLCRSESVGLSIDADVYGPRTFTWQRNGVQLSVGNSPFLQVFGSDPDASGVYTCIVSDAYGITLASAYVSVCSVDLNCDKQVDLDDFFAFFNCFSASQPCADIDLSGEVDLGDFFEFFNKWDAQDC